MRYYQDKVAVVTGGASGIGLALATQLLSHGATVVIADLDHALAVKSAAALGGRVEAAALDVTDAAAFAALVRGVVARHGRVDLLFNNAGILVLGQARDVEAADWHRMIDVNLRGVIHGMQAVYPLMIEQGHGHIVNTGSVAGLVAAPGFACYAATKHAVVGLSTSLRPEAASHGVRVSVACPGFVRTPIFQNAGVAGMDRARVLGKLERMPNLIGADECARGILAGVAANRAVIVVPRSWRLLCWASRVSPLIGNLLTSRLSRGFTKRPRPA